MGWGGVGCGEQKLCYATKKAKGISQAHAHLEQRAPSASPPRRLQDRDAHDVDRQAVGVKQEESDHPPATADAAAPASAAAAANDASAASAASAAGNRLLCRLCRLCFLRPQQPHAAAELPQLGGQRLVIAERLEVDALDGRQHFVGDVGGRGGGRHAHCGVFGVGGSHFAALQTLGSSAACSYALHDRDFQPELTPLAVVVEERSDRRRSRSKV